MPPSQTPQGVAYFPGVQQVRSGSITVVHGISPGVATLEIAPQAGMIAEGGNLVFAYAGQQMQWRGCKIDQASFRRDSSGFVVGLTIFDRRWRWAWGWISGQYNVRKADGSIKKDTEKTPQELARLLFAAMGEQGYDVSQMPNDARPEIEWDGDVPAEALADLCDQLGCRIVPSLDDRFRILRAGVGAELPSGGEIEKGMTVDPPERPDRIAIMGGKTEWQADFELEAVGEETDDSIKPIDELSYKPAGGWSEIDLPYMSAIENQDHRERAKRSVFKCYRIKSPAVVPNAAEKSYNLDQLLPIKDEQIEQQSQMVDGKEVLTRKPAMVYGVWFADLDGTLLNSAAKIQPPKDSTGGTDGDPQIYRRDFTVDAQRGLVRFSDYVYRNTEDGESNTSREMVLKKTAGPAILRLRCTVCLRESKTRGWIRYGKQRATGGNYGTPMRVIRHDEIVLTSIPRYTETYSVDGYETNMREVDRECDYYLDAAMLEYETEVPTTKRYLGLRRIELDGAIHQVTYSVGTSGAFTTACRNTEDIDLVPPYKERRRLEKQRQSADRLKRLTQVLGRIS